MPTTSKAVLKGWTEAVESIFKSSSRIVGVTGPAHPDCGDNKLSWFPEELDWLIGCTRWFKSNIPVEVRNCWGMNMAFRKDALQETGLFSPDTGFIAGHEKGRIGEDVEFSLRMRAATGGRLYYIPGALVYTRVHSYRLNDRFVIERSRWIGQTRRSILQYERGRLRSGHSKETRLLMSLPGIFLSSNGLPGRVLPTLLKRAKLLILVLYSLGIGYAFGSLVTSE